LLGADPERTQEAVTEDELHSFVATQSFLTPEHRLVISGAVEVGRRVLREVVIPRREVTTLSAELDAAAALTILATQGHSRAPVVAGDDFDDVIGVAHMRDLIAGGTVRDATRAAPLLPESLGVLDGLNRLRAERAQMGIVIDEHGGAEGIVSVEDLLEEIVGEIYDETDTDVASAQRRSDGSFVLIGSFPFHDLADLGIALPDGEYSTVAGFLLDRMGRIPDRVGESVDVAGWTMIVEGLDGRVVTRVSARPSEPAEGPTPAS
jgi:putative hemolysin